MCFEMRVKMHGVVPDHISCLTVSNIHPALQMLQLALNIRGKSLEILTPALPSTPPPNICLFLLCQHCWQNLPIMFIVLCWLHSLCCVYTHVQFVHLVLLWSQLSQLSQGMTILSVLF